MVYTMTSISKSARLENARDQAEEISESAERAARLAMNADSDSTARIEANAAQRYYTECRAIADNAPFVDPDDPPICSYYYADTQHAAERARVAALNARQWADDPQRRTQDQARADSEIVAATAAHIAAYRAYRSCAAPDYRELHDTESRVRAAYVAVGIVPPTLINA